MAETVDEYAKRMMSLSTDVKRSVVHDMITKMLPDSNLARSSVYVEPETIIKSYPHYDFIGGFVSPKDTKNLYVAEPILRGETFKGAPSLAEVFAHETAHVQKNKSNKNFNNMLTLELATKLEPKAKELGLAYNALQNSVEFMANLQAAEALAPQGKTVWDTPLGKAVLEADPGRKRLLDSRILPNYDHVTEIPEQNLLDIIRNWVNNKLPTALRAK